MRILVTGASGFIGHAVCMRLVNDHHEIVGIDNLNDYYDPEIKKARLKDLDIDFHCLDVGDLQAMNEIFQLRPEIVIHLAAQAGVRYSTVNPHIYIHSNVNGFLNILECCRAYSVKHLLYASSSSAKGLKSVYAISKYSNELMARNYQDLFQVPATGMRFFSVYGPNGRPDMVLSLFADSIKRGDPIPLFNSGNCKRSFTYIDDVVEAIVRLFAVEPGEVYDIGNPESVSVNQLVTEMEKYLGQAKKKMLPMQAGDVLETKADITLLHNNTGFYPQIGIEEGIRKMYS